jgi:hypothetical protein
MAEYNFREIEQKWQGKWSDQGTYTAEIDPLRPKFYSLDMFPYPSGAGLHVGHPLGYIASDEADNIPSSLAPKTPDSRHQIVLITPAPANQKNGWR